MKLIPISSPNIDRSERRAVVKVLKSLSLSQGTEVSSFEREFSKFVGDRDCIAVNSGTSALQLALIAMNIQPGDEVIVPSFTFAATANVVRIVGAIPIFVDIDPITYCIDPKLITSLINSKTKAIIVVHLYGLPANMHEIQRIAETRNILVIEDAAQAHLASINSQKVGTFGAIAAFSFYATKNMTTGEGGMIVTSSSDITRKCRLLRNQGMETKYSNEIIGYNLRMTDFQAAIGRCQLKKLEIWTEKRISNANFLNRHLNIEQLPFTPDGYRHVFHQYTIRVQRNRSKLSSILDENRIGNAIYYPTPVHKLLSFLSNNTLHESEKASLEVLSLPVHPKLTKPELNKIVRVFNSAINVV
jgi:perosamine synthetase